MVITITPFDPLAPYADVAEASFNTVILSISELFNEAKALNELTALDPEKFELFTGTPSITIMDHYPH